MPIGQAAFAALAGSAVTKRFSFLVLRAKGVSATQADLASDRLAITSCHAAMTFVGIATLDPIGLAGGAAYVGLLEAELRRKEEEVAQQEHDEAQRKQILTRLLMQKQHQTPKGSS